MILCKQPAIDTNCLYCINNWQQPTFHGWAALFYSPVDFTDASDLHQTVVKFIGWSIESDKITLLKIKFNQENCQQKDTPLILKQMSCRMIDSPRCCFIPFIGWKFDASMHTSVRCIGEINRWIKQRSHAMWALRCLRCVHCITCVHCICVWQVGNWRD